MEAETSPVVEPVFGRVVLDACVLYPVSLRDTLLRAAEHGLYQPVWSELILEEMRRNLVEDRRIDASRSRLIAQMRLAFPRAEVDVPEDLIAQLTNPVEDRHVLAAAVVAGAATIVTANLRDFPRAALEPYGIVAISPDRFLQRLLDVVPSLMLGILREQVAGLVNSPRTLDDVLGALATHVPRFAARARAVSE